VLGALGQSVHAAQLPIAKIRVGGSLAILPQIAVGTLGRGRVAVGSLRMGRTAISGSLKKRML
jgi:hypothetical protein